MKLKTSCFIAATAALLASGGLYACRTSSTAATLREADGDAISELKWRDKVSQRLRYGSRLTVDEEASLASLTRDQFIGKMMEDPRFGLTILDFNMDFLGRQVDHLVDQGESGANFDPGVPAQPQALASAAAVMNGGDYFQFFSPSPQLMIESPSQATSPEFIAQLTSMFDSAIGSYTEDESGRSNFCFSTQDLAQSLVVVQGPFSFDPFAEFNVDPGVRYLLNLIGRRWVNSISGSERFGDFNSAEVGDCLDQSVPGQTLVERLKRVKSATFELLSQIDSKRRAPTSQPMNDLIPLDLASTEGLPPLNTPFTYEGQWRHLKNSSTNVNRKRAAYILRTYTCDDMTPVSLSSGAGMHAENGHATLPGCQACHYKMDPIAAIFVPIGIAGNDFSKRPNHVFDDGLNLQKNSDQYKKKYIDQYNDPAGNFRIGHYRTKTKLYPEWTVTDPAKVDMETLFTYFTKSPVVQACLTRRLTEYFLGKKQVYDGLWIDSLAKKFKQEPDKTVAVKGVISNLLQSKTFARATVTPGECYDFAQGNEPGANSPPCEVSAVINKYCVSCHSTDDPSSGLDLEKWIQGPTGWQFAHFKPDAGEPQLRDRAESFKWLIGAITDPASIDRGDLDGDGVSDPLPAMPLSKDMPESDKQTLFKWLKKQLAEVTP